MTYIELGEIESDELIKIREEYMDLLTPNGNNWEELIQLLEIERLLTQREGIA